MGYCSSFTKKRIRTANDHHKTCPPVTTPLLYSVNKRFPDNGIGDHGFFVSTKHNGHIARGVVHYKQWAACFEPNQFVERSSEIRGWILLLLLLLLLYYYYYYDYYDSTNCDHYELGVN